MLWSGFHEAEETAFRLLILPEGEQRSELEAERKQETGPTIERGLVELRQVHAGDPPEELEADTRGEQGDGAQPQPQRRPGPLRRQGQRPEPGRAVRVPAGPGRGRRADPGTRCGAGSGAGPA